MTITKMFPLLMGVMLFMQLGCELNWGKTMCGTNCDLEPDKGPCRAIIAKFYYDKIDRKCTEFSWGGCDGVVPFDTMEDCLACECNRP